MWSTVVNTAIIGFFIWLTIFSSSVLIFLGDDISDWIQAKADEIRTRTELLRKEHENDNAD